MITNEQAEQASVELSSILDFVRWAYSRFHQAGLFFGHGTDNAWDEAMSLVLQLLHLPQSASETELPLMACKLTADERALLVEAIAKRVNERIPNAYLTNQAWFAGMPFYVDERVLIPRSPFAELIDKRFSDWVQQAPAHILDLCTGSGCIAIALAHAFPDAQVDAVDISDEALAVAEININEYELADRVYPIQSDLMSALAGQKYQLIISNPPYVDGEDMADLPEEFQYEPELGLAAGEDGLDLVEHILQQALEHLTDDGWLFVEVGNSQVHMDARFWGLKVQWVELELGGHGLFAINRRELAEYFSAKAS